MNEEMIWFRQGELDLNSAKYLLDGKIYYASAFYCQQCVEKTLKAFLIKDKKELIKTHSVRKLSKILNLPDELQDKIVKLEDIERLARYPVGDGEDLSVKYSEKDVEMFLKIAEEVVEWIRNKMML